MNEKIFLNKSILLAIPEHFGLPERFKENLEFLGFEVFLIKQNFKVKISLKDIIIHNFKKNFKKDKTFKKLRKKQLIEEKQLNDLKNINKHLDYSLIIRPDLYTEKVIKNIVEKTNKSIAYQWDGLDRFPEIYHYIKYFNKFYVFDENDLIKCPNCILTTNFYFDDLIHTETPTEIKNSIFFIGTIMDNRVEILEKIGEKCIQSGLTTDISIYAEDVKNFESKYIKFTNKNLSFKESLNKVKSSHFLLDLHNPVHNGLSFRTFEAIGYQKKIITNNSLVKKYDFYNPDNFYVFNNSDINGLEDFIKIPYKNIDFNIKEYYSFTKWIERTLE